MYLSRGVCFSKLQGKQQDKNMGIDHKGKFCLKVRIVTGEVYIRVLSSAFDLWGPSGLVHDAHCHPGYSHWVENAGLLQADHVTSLLMYALQEDVIHQAPNYRWT